MGALNTTVYVHDLPFGETKNVFGPGEEVPEWAAKQMGAHCFEDREHPFPDAIGEKPAVEEKERAEGTPPPKAGQGSGRDNWVAYADEMDVEVPKGTPRDAIIQILVDAGKPVDPPQ